MSGGGSLAPEGGLRDFHEAWPAAVQQGRGAFPKQRAHGFRSLAVAELVFTPVSCRVSVGGVSTIGWSSVLFSRAAVKRPGNSNIILAQFTAAVSAL